MSEHDGSNKEEAVITSRSADLRPESRASEVEAEGPTSDDHGTTHSASASGPAAGGSPASSVVASGGQVPPMLPA